MDAATAYKTESVESELNYKIPLYFDLKYYTIPRLKIIMSSEKYSNKDTTTGGGGPLGPEGDCIGTGGADTGNIMGELCNL